MFITVKSVGPVEVKQGPKAQYQVFALTYDKDGQETTKNIMEFSKEVFGKFKNAAVGSSWNVEVKKNGKYWDWVNASPAAGGAEVARSAPSGGTGRGFETPEERALKQIYIVRQSSIASALTYSGQQKSALPLAEVLLIAKKFEEFVFGKSAIQVEPSLDEGDIN